MPTSNKNFKFLCKHLLFKPHLSYRDNRQYFIKMGYPGDFFIQRIAGYDITEKNLGKGAFASVELAIHCMTNINVAIKIVDIDKITEPYVRKNILRESAILKNLRHENIVHLYETLAYRNKYCFVMEYLNGGDLHEYVKKQKLGYLVEKESRRIFVQLLLAVRYLHSRGIIHRDLKMQNIMLTKGQKKIKLIDFGLSNTFSEEKLLETKCGSAEYAAPELFEKGNHYGPAVEIWSMGVILFAMTTGQKPFQPGSHDKKESFITQIRRGLNISHEELLKKLSPDLKHLLSRLLEPDKEKRVTLQHCSKHIWVTDNGKRPVLPLAPVMVRHEVRKKAIEKVSKLYNQPLEETAKHLRSNTFDSMNATYQILLDNAFEHLKDDSNNVSRKPGRQKRSVSLPFGKTEATKIFSRDTLLAQLKRENDGGKASETNYGDLKYDLNSCLQISKKSACCFSSKSISPPIYNTRPVSTDDFKQIPFRLSPPLDNHHHKKPHKSPRLMAKHKTESNLIETTLEGVFEVNSHTRNNGDKDNQVEITSNQIHVSFNGKGLTSGSFKITEKTRTLEANDKQNIENVNPGARCLSPFEARRMLHRATFPLKKNTMKPQHTADNLTVKNGKIYSTKQLELQKRNLCQMNVELNYDGTPKHDFISNATSKENKISRMNSAKDRTLSPNRFGLEDTEKILKNESKMNEEFSGAQLSKKNTAPISKIRDGSIKQLSIKSIRFKSFQLHNNYNYEKPMKKVSFKK